ncbi:two-component regulator propeller domain-containing protein [Vibrio cidicii]|uniref:two-component regulator propeller domain-containing protein n=1 Tax=Vibrio cidicii TaxID=1763883 RepID=UPI003F50FCC1
MSSINWAPLFFHSRRLAILILTALCSTSLFAQPLRLSDYFSETWSSNQGLPHNSINAIVQTQDGYLWFATWEGVARYNGLNFKRFDRNPHTHMLDSGTRSLTADSANRLWVGGARGSLALRQGYTWHEQPPLAGLVNYIFVDLQQNLWFAIEGKGVVFRPHLNDGRYGEDQWRLTNISAYRLAQDANGAIIAATDAGLYRLTENAAQKLSSTQFERVSYVSSAPNGDILLGTNRGAWRWDGQILSPVENALLSTVVTVVEQDSAGSIWFGTINRGVARLSSHGLEWLDARQGLPNNRVLSWLEDQQGNIWIGTNGGIIRLREAPFVSVTQEQGLIGNYVRTLLEIADDHLLIGSSNGLSVLDSSGARAVPSHGENLSVLSLAKRSADSAWVGTYQHGLMVFQAGQLSLFLSENSGLPTNEIRALLQDSQNNLWVGTPAGLVKRSPDGTLRYFSKENGELVDNYVMALAEDEFGKIWVGTGLGVSVLSGEHFSRLNLDKLEAAQYAFGFYTEPGYVWIATDRGVVRYRQRDKTTALVGRPQGLPIDKFFQVVNDGQGHFWLSSNRGIWRIGYEQAHRVADGMYASLEFEHYDENDGMASSQANGGSNPAAIITKAGRLYFATAKGVASIHPDSLAHDTKHQLPVVLESVKFDSTSVDVDSRGHVPAGTTRVSFSYVGLGYVMSERLQYRTKLEGFDNEWSYRGNATTVEYTYLPPGKYRLCISARSPYGEWHDAQHVYQFTVYPSFWQRTEVRIAVVLAALILLVAAIRWRLSALKRNELQLKKQVALQTQEIRAQAEKYERLSKEDVLTGLANRRAFDNEIKATFNQAKKNQQRFFVAILDIDFFKRINDKYSHLAGDKAIVAIAHILRDYAQSPEKTARWGGEEFTLLYQGDQPYAYFEQLRERIEQSRFDDIDPDLTITASIGFADSDNAQSYEEVLKRADHALLKAKRNGRNRTEC